ncbi:MAG: thiamine pyrophosphate-dependent dehydrogenase E1 component subunit alpha [Candidatus Omnitrophica bacterium]|nr:thiamine pyrophosphate-dependent dehydrogenase E1 component subunit alpha [Candidatus Omnitrophota bacterium]
MLTTMLRIRRFEEKIIALYPEQQMKTPVHLYLGQEAIACGVCLNLKKEDYIFSTHRNHGHCIAKGMPLKTIMAELYGKKTGCSKGKGGSMHLVDPDRGILGTSSIVGGSIPVALGAALTSKMKRNRRVSVVFFGDGAVDTGTFHECLNFASLKRLPVIFACENNFYATNSPLLARQPADNIFKRAKPYLIESLRVDGNDIIKVYESAGEAIKKAKNGYGPTLIEYRTYRFRQHVGPDCDYETGCRPKEELDRWMRNCPIKRFKGFLLKNNIISLNEIDKITTKIDKEIKEATIFAENSPFPEEGELLEDVY